MLPSPETLKKHYVFPGFGRGDFRDFLGAGPETPIFIAFRDLSGGNIFAKKNLVLENEALKTENFVNFFRRFCRENAFCRNATRMIRVFFWVVSRSRNTIKTGVSGFGAKKTHPRAPPPSLIKGWQRVEAQKRALFSQKKKP